MNMTRNETSHNKRVSGFVPSALRPNPRFAQDFKYPPAVSHERSGLCS